MHARVISFGTPMRATRKAILTDARNGLLGNGYAQGMGQIPDARNLHPGATPLTLPNHFFYQPISGTQSRCQGWGAP